EDGIRDFHVTGVQTCALPIYLAFTGFPPGSGRPASGWSEEPPAAWWAGGSCAPVRRSVERVVGHERPGRRRPPHGHQPRSRSAAALSASGFREVAWRWASMALPVLLFSASAPRPSTNCSICSAVGPD